MLAFLEPGTLPLNLQAKAEVLLKQFNFLSEVRRTRPAESEKSHQCANSISRNETTGFPPPSRFAAFSLINYMIEMGAFWDLLFPFSDSGDDPVHMF